MARRTLPHLVFSTRSPEPRGGSDFVREVVAESDGVSEAARRELARRADIAGSALHHRLEEGRRALAFSFNPLPDGTWLLARAVSLGLYRKGSHHLLIHGVVLGREELEALDGNPLLLALDEVQEESGFAFREEHPGQESRLEPLRFDDRVAARCRSLDRERLEALGEAAWEPWLAAAYDALAAGERLALVLPSPRPEPVEWLLLHLHPEDRLEVSFHTFYSYDRAVDARLLLLVPDDVSRVQGQLRPLRLLDLQAAPPSSPMEGLGTLARRLRRRSAGAYLDTLARVQLTHLARHSRPPLAPEDARVALLAGLHDLGLGGPLSPAEEERYRLLRQRAKLDLGFHVAHLAAEWRQRPRRLDDALARLAATQERITGDEVDRFLDERLAEGLAGWLERWALAALLVHEPALEPDDGWEARRCAAWARLTPPERFGELLAAFGEEQAAEAEPLLLRYALAAVRGGGAPREASPYWQTLVLWLDGRGRKLAPALAGVEEALAGLPETEAAGGFRRLGELCWRIGRPAAALRLLLGRELPLLDETAARSRLRRALEEAMAAADAEQDRLLARSLGDRRVAEEVFAALAAWLVRLGETEAAAGWERIAAMLRGDGDRRPSDPPAADPESLGTDTENTLAPESAASCGILLAALAASPLSAKAVDALDLACRRLPAEADAGAFAAIALAAAAAPLAARCEGAWAGGETARLVAAAASLLDARCAREDARAADPELMRLGVRGKVLATAAGARSGRGEAVERFAGIWPGFLKSSLRGGLFDRAGDEAREWLGLLADELVESPPRRVEDDSRYEAFLRLAWAEWSREAEAGAPGPAGVKVLQALGWGETPAARGWHRRLIAAVVPEDRRPAAWAQAALRLDAVSAAAAGETR